jgi:hypothetical protein
MMNWHVHVMDTFKRTHLPHPNAHICHTQTHTFATPKRTHLPHPNRHTDSCTHTLPTGGPEAAVLHLEATVYDFLELLQQHTQLCISMGSDMKDDSIGQAKAGAAAVAALHLCCQVGTECMLGGRVCVWLVMWCLIGYDVIGYDVMFNWLPGRHRVHAGWEGVCLIGCVVFDWLWCDWIWCDVWLVMLPGRHRVHAGWEGICLTGYVVYDWLWWDV